MAPLSTTVGKICPCLILVSGASFTQLLDTQLSLGTAKSTDIQKKKQTGKVKWIDLINGWLCIREKLEMKENVGWKNNV